MSIYLYVIGWLGAMGYLASMHKGARVKDADFTVYCIVAMAWPVLVPYAFITVSARKIYSTWRER